MKNIALIALLFAGSVMANDVYVAPHVRSDGVYVQGHYRTAPDNNLYNNYSTQGNFNPYTGQAGTVNPYQQPPATYNPQNYTPQIIQPAPQTDYACVSKCTGAGHQYNQCTQVCSK